MKQSMGWLQVGVISIGLLSGCTGGADKDNAAEDMGSIALPLVTHGPSGTAYRLRNASFQIVPNQYYWTTYGAANGTGGTATSTGVYPGTTVGTLPIGTTPSEVVVVNSEDNPDSDSIQVELRSGDYYIQLLSGWSLEKSENGEFVPVEAQLLSGETQWVWISPYSTSWVNYQFGIGSEALWFNGSLNVNVQVVENPAQYYGSGGYGATGGATYCGSSTGGAPYVTTAGGSTAF